MVGFTIRLLRTALLCLLAALFVPRPATAQRLGQWWWLLDAGYRSNSFASEAPSGRRNEFDQGESRVDLSLHGYLGHPLLGDFRLETGLSDLDNSDSGGKRETRNRSYGLGVNILPRGKYRLALSYRKGSSESSPATFLFGPSQPSSHDHAAGRLYFAAGALAGTRIGFDRLTLVPVDDSLGNDLRTNTYLDWTRRLGRFSNRLKIESVSNRQGYLGLSTDQTHGSFAQHGSFGSGWRTDLSLSSRLLDFRFEDQKPQEGTDHNLQWNLQRPVFEHDDVSLSLFGTYSQFGDGESTRSQGFSTSYLYRSRTRSLQISPSVRYALVQFPSADQTLLGAGLQIHGSRRYGNVDLSGSVRTGFDTSSSAGSAASPAGSDSFSGGLVATLSHLARRGLKTDLEIEWGRNEVRFDRSEELALESTTVVSAAPGRDDYGRLRLRLDRPVYWGHLGGSLGFGLRDTVLLSGESVSREDYSASLSAGIRSLSLTLSGSSSFAEGDDGGANDQRSDTASLNLAWTPMRGLGFSAAYRIERRDLERLLRTDSRRLDVAASWQIGLLTASVGAFEFSEGGGGGAAPRSHGLTWSLRRRFAGWLPIVTAYGTKRKGEIR